MTTSAAAISIGSLDSEDWNACALPWKLVAREAGLPSCCSTWWMRCHRVADRHAGLQIEGDRHRRELALMVDHQWRDLVDRRDQRAQRHLLSARGVDIDILKRIGSELELRLDLEHDVVLVLPGSDGRDDALAERIVERVVDRRRQNAVTRGDIALDRISSNGPAFSWSLATSVIAGNRLQLV